jgi:menaquinone-9 beta-reductase
MTTRRADALIIGAGPSGSATAILLARAGWQVTLVEKESYPRRKVCGECLTAGSLELLDSLGVGDGVRAFAGPELRTIGWMDRRATLIADFPVCERGPYRYGRALRREHLDVLLRDRALAMGVVVLQPAKVSSVQGGPGNFQCDIDLVEARQRLLLEASTVIDAHGSWQRGPAIASGGSRHVPRKRQRASDLFAFKAVFEQTRLSPGHLPVMALPGGYGGMVVVDDGLATLACCLRRDALSACRIGQQGLLAGDAVEAYLRRNCLGLREALSGARRSGSWLTVGPLWPGAHGLTGDTLLRVGNAAGESHPLIGEGIGMALQSAVLLTAELKRFSPAAMTARALLDLQHRYALASHHAFSRRLHAAALYAHIAMRPFLASAARALMARWPSLLTQAAQLAGKARANGTSRSSTGVRYEYT